MATCKDCAHVDICEFYAKTINNGLRKYYEPEIPFDKDRVHSEPCELFKDRSRFVELPCKVGDVVYCLTLPEKRRVTRITVTQYGLRITVNDMFSFDTSQIGRTVFLTKEAAEQALKGRENNG